MILPRTPLKARLALHWQILLGLVLGAVFGGMVGILLGSQGVSFVTTYVRPVGTLFIRLITMIAAPLVLSSLVVGASSVSDPARLGRIGAKTVLLYLSTTALAITIGLITANILRPGSGLPEQTSARLLQSYGDQAVVRIERAQDVGIVEQILQLVPTNPFEALAAGNMLQIVVFALLVGIALTLIPTAKAQPVIGVFDGFTEVLIKIVEIVMRVAPFGVFALIAGVTAEFGFSILGTLGWYAVAVVVALATHVVAVYGGALHLLARGHMPLRTFMVSMASVQLLAFSSSSSAAALPLNMETVRDRLGVSERVTSFVLPLGATVNMDGTALYQGVAAVFIAQVYGLGLGLLDQLTIVFTATLASIGSAAVPGAGIVMLVIVLQAVGIPLEGIALIFGIDRLLDMCRTAVNVTGDAVVAVVVARSEGELGPPPASSLDGLPLAAPDALVQTPRPGKDAHESENGSKHRGEPEETTTSG